MRRHKKTKARWVMWKEILKTGMYFFVSLDSSSKRQSRYTGVTRALAEGLEMGIVGVGDNQRIQTPERDATKTKGHQ